MVSRMNTHLHSWSKLNYSTVGLIRYRAVLFLPSQPPMWWTGRITSTANSNKLQPLIVELFSIQMSTPLRIISSGDKLIATSTISITPSFGAWSRKESKTPKSSTDWKIPTQERKTKYYSHNSTSTTTASIPSIGEAQFSATSKFSTKRNHPKC